MNARNLLFTYSGEYTGEPVWEWEKGVDDLRREVLVAGLGDRDVLLNVEADASVPHVDTDIDGENHAGRHGISFGPYIVHVETNVVGAEVTVVFAEVQIATDHEPRKKKFKVF